MGSTDWHSLCVATPPYRVRGDCPHTRGHTRTYTDTPWTHFPLIIFYHRDDRDRVVDCIILHGEKFYILALSRS